MGMNGGGARAKPWIRVVGEAGAAGLLAQHYEDARRRAGKVFNILKIQSLRPRQLGASIELYKTVMYGESALSRAERELAATVVSIANHCHY